MERVYTVPDWYDGPRGGVADFNGLPHYFESEWSDLEKNCTDTYMLSPIDKRVFELAIEDWEIWERFCKSYHNEKVEISSHPCLPEDKLRNEELEKILDKELKIDQSNVIRASAVFKVDEKRKKPYQKPFSLLVQWTKLKDNNTSKRTASTRSACLDVVRVRFERKERTR